MRERRPGRQNQGPDAAVDDGEDEVGRTGVAAFEARGPLDLPYVEGRDHPDQHEHREDIDHQRVPALCA